MEQKKKPFNKGGCKPKLAPRTHRYSLNLDDVENAKFLAFYDQSGYKVKAHFIKNCIFGKSFKVLRIDKSKVDYYIQLSRRTSGHASRISFDCLYPNTEKAISRCTCHTGRHRSKHAPVDTLRLLARPCAPKHPRGQRCRCTDIRHG